MTLTQLKKRQQTLLNLIANVGGKSNTRKWIDELMVVEAEIEQLDIVVKIVYIDDISHTCSHWAVLVNGVEVQNFNTRAKSDRYLQWKGLKVA